MKLTGEPRRGGKKFVRAQEVLTGEQPERPVVEWVDPMEHQPVIKRLQKMITVEKGNETMRQYAKIAAYLKIICRMRPELFTIDQRVLDGLATETYELTQFIIKDNLIGYFSPNIRQTLESTVDVTDFQQEMNASLTHSPNQFVQSAFAIRIGAPNLLKWFAVRKHIDKLLSSIQKEKDYVGAALLMVMYPEKRGQITQLFSPEDLKAFGQYVRKDERQLLASESMDPKRAADFVRDLFAQQVFSSSEARITPEGEVVITPPVGKLPPRSELPVREMI